MAQASANIDEKYQAYFAGLTELVQFPEKGNMDAYFAQPTRGMQNALGAALGEYAKASGELYHSAFTQSQNDYRFAKWQMAVLALALVIVLVAVWYGIRHILLNPLGRVIAHIRDIGRGDLTKTLTVSGRNEITELATSVDHMQRSLIDTVANVREGRMPSIPARVKSRWATTISRPVPNSRRPLWKRRRQAWSSSPRP